MLSSWLLLLVSFIFILASSELFTRAIEWLGWRLRMHEGAVGSVLAAVGTALPETMIPLIAIAGAAGAGASARHVAADIGIGAILGAPFLLATIALGVMAGGIVYYRRKSGDWSLRVDATVARRDLRFFLLGYSLAAIAALIPSTPPLFHPDTPLEWLKLAIGVFLLPLYGFYLWRVLRQKRRAEGTEARVDRLQLSFLGHRRDGEPTTFAIVAQVAVALALMIGGAQLFVTAVTEVSSSLGVSASVLALLLAPLATELPEKFNSVIWIRQRKDTLAFANISGAMVFQGCIPVTVGILLTDWHFHFELVDDRLRLLSVGLALGGALMTLAALRRNEIRFRALIAGAVLYAGFLVAVFASYVLAAGGFAA